MITASCHCGKVSLRFSEMPESVTECNCSICRRYAARWAYYRREQVTVDAPSGSLSAYIWGDRMIEFRRCNDCGCVTHYEDVEKLPSSRLAVNMRMLPEEALAGIRVRKFDGADTWKVVED